MAKLLSFSVKVIGLLMVTVIVLATAFVVACNSGATPYRLYAVRTGSMGHTIPPRSEVVVRKGQYHVGQVISFTYAGETITHRLIKLHDGYATTKGDANGTADPWTVPEKNIIGGVVAAPKQAGFALLFVTHSWVGKLDIMLLFLLVWLIVTFPETEEPPAAIAAS